MKPSFLLFLSLAACLQVGCHKDVSSLADVLKKEPTVEICASPSPQKRIPNPFLKMSEEQIAEFLSGFSLDGVTYVPNVELRAQEFNLNYTANRLVVNFLNPNSGKWLQVSREKADIDHAVLQEMGAVFLDGENILPEIPGTVRPHDRHP